MHQSFPAVPISLWFFSICIFLKDGQIPPSGDTKAVWMPQGGDIGRDHIPHPCDHCLPTPLRFSNTRTESMKLEKTYRFLDFSISTRVICSSSRFTAILRAICNFLALSACTKNTHIANSMQYEFNENNIFVEFVLLLKLFQRLLTTKKSRSLGKFSII